MSTSPQDGILQINNNGGSTGKGILIGVLSAFGSAGVAVLVLAIFFFFKYTNRGRILLDRIGRPGEFDDEQAFAKEEAEALETMDELQKAEYLRAKGKLSWVSVESIQGLTADNHSLHPSKSSGDSADRHFLITIPCHPGKRGFRVGIRARAGNR